MLGIEVILRMAVVIIGRLQTFIIVVDPGRVYHRVLSRANPNAIMAVLAILRMWDDSPMVSFH